MPSEETKILKFNQYQKFDKASFITYADLECLTEKINEYKNNVKIHSQEKVGQHFPSGFSMPMTSSFKTIGNKYDVYRGKDSMKKFCECLREHAVEMIIFKRKNEVINK